MNQSLQAVYENGVLRPLEPLQLKDQQQVTVTVSDEEGDLLDATFLRYLESQADDSVSLETVRRGLEKIRGSLVEDFRSERDESS